MTRPNRRAGKGVSGKPAAISFFNDVKKFNAFLEGFPAGIMLLRRERLWYANPSAINLLGGNAEKSLVGMPINELIAKEDLGHFQSVVRRLNDKNASTPSLEMTLLRQDNSTIRVKMTLTIYRNRAFTMIRCVVVELTNLTKIDNEKTHSESSKHPLQIKEALLSSLGHEIRAPLNTIIGFSQLLERDGSLSPKQLDHVQTIVRSGEQLLKCVNSILELSKMEAGQFKLIKKVFSLFDLLDELYRIFRFRAEEKNLRFVKEFDQELPDQISGDEDKMRHVYLNLLGNALKHTQRGRVLMRVKSTSLNMKRSVIGKESVSPSDCSEKRVILHFEVEDTGPGISRDEISFLFDSTLSADPREPSGSVGLGLAISRTFAELMEGSIDVESQPGYGSRFRCSIPIEVLPTTESSHESRHKHVKGLASIHDKVTVMVVDDQKDNRKLLHLLLESVGFKVVSAENGLLALDLFAKSNPDVVLMDIRMPVMDGMSATKTIKAKYSARKIPIIAVTANPLEEKGLLLGGLFDGFLRKPIDVDKLFALLKDLLHLTYTYDTPSDDEHGVESTPLTQEEMKELPQELLQAMLQSVEKGEMVKFKELLSTIHQTHPRIAQELAAFAKKFDYETLGKLLSR